MKQIIPADPSGNSQFGAGLSLNGDGSFIGVGLADKGNNLQTKGELQLFQLDEGGTEEYIVYDIVPVGAGEVQGLSSEVYIGRRLIDAIPALRGRLGGVGLAVVESDPTNAARAITMNDNGVVMFSANIVYSGEDTNGDGFEDSTGQLFVYDPDLAGEPPDPLGVTIGETQEFVSLTNFAGNDRSLDISETQRVAVVANSSVPTAEAFDQLIIFTNAVADPDGNPYSQVQVITTTKSDLHRLGRAVAINDDGSLIAASEPDFNTGGLSGSLSIYEESGLESENWILKQQISPSVQTEESFFGAEMAATRDLSRIIVSSPNEESSLGSTDWGRLFVYRRDGESWNEEQVIDLPANGNAGAYGCDISNDGARIVWGDVASGKVWVFSRTDITWTLDGSYDNPGAGNNGFANPVHLSNDGTKVAVSARSESTVNGTNSGAVYVFDFATDTLTPPP